jgi:hypothetical protein
MKSLSQADEIAQVGIILEPNIDSRFVPFLETAEKDLLARSLNVLDER